MFAYILSNMSSNCSTTPIHVSSPSLQGTMFWSVFVLGHDCGHASFSRYPLLNDCIGTLLHTAILVPYYPWKVG